MTECQYAEDMGMTEHRCVVRCVYEEKGFSDAIEQAARVAERYDDTDTLTAPKAIAASIRALSARCSPDAIREIAAYVRDLEERLAKAAEALEQIADLTARCEHDGGFDREIGPIGCNLGDKCLCIGLHPIARTALSSIKGAK